MKKLVIAAIALFISTASFAQKKKDLIKEVAALKSEASTLKNELNELKKAKEVNLNDSIHKFSYAFGVEIGSSLKSVGVQSINYDVFAVALEETLNGEEKITKVDASDLIRKNISEHKEKEAKRLRAEGENFLAKNAKREGIKTTESGLQYEILTPADGTKPTADDKVEVHYEGKLIDGTIFDSSMQRGESIVFGVSQVIKGWTEALQLMSVGSKYRVYIPQELAYGERGAGGQIPPYAALIFDVELISIK
ncbi:MULTISPECIES: FKBP-type peptidyl-prolyl cis-trans isomerase [unclassified Cellulophaga]|uniref:FKBP-type peptidyl-prolyl cis-trans isomerase n=1 Tax=unclassified Cellulophaga TaxID=2634405 RepID=UPI0026E1E65F|nr:MULTISPECIES: FKBP-type peptidyl-prolyl cis-trans isomerase [unclassified Cellulophaga]MDO6489824.1 FKBP-type peptidyl-prolyl cis-trans isomerase [Cellulophaga sp. 2_MG-2023]MDO6494982.1 FKBP-type peptidyl-prolyl cis-trans isomerase [Cellulophaga sp. 3_MG-2023]